MAISTRTKFDAAPHLKGKDLEEQRKCLLRAALADPGFVDNVSDLASLWADEVK